MASNAMADMGVGQQLLDQTGDGTPGHGMMATGVG
jgi:hypothetical protein